MLGCQLLTRHRTLHCTYDLGPFVSDLSAQCSLHTSYTLQGGERGQGGPPFHCGEMLSLSLGAAVSFTCNLFTPQYLPIFLYTACKQQQSFMRASIPRAYSHYYYYAALILQLLLVLNVTPRDMTSMRCIRPPRAWTRI